MDLGGRGAGSEMGGRGGRARALGHPLANNLVRGVTRGQRKYQRGARMKPARPSTDNRQNGELASLVNGIGCCGRLSAYNRTAHPPFGPFGRLGLKGRPLTRGHAIMSKSAFLLAAVIGATVASGASAQEMTYRPINPSFGGSPYNSQHLMGLAQIQNKHKPKATTTEMSDQERFLASVRSRVYGRLANEISDAIFGEDAQDKGQIDMGGQTVFYERLGDEILLRLLDGDKVTEIRFPTASAY